MNYDSRNDLRFADHVQRPVQKQERPVPNRRLGQHGCFTHLEWSEWDERHRTRRDRESRG